jgi:hypothetical protein
MKIDLAFLSYYDTMYKHYDVFHMCRWYPCGRNDEIGMFLIRGGY